eukprot:COSAG02_NODE_3905_length_6058_cov_5.265481_6_plen_68_part_00
MQVSRRHYETTAAQVEEEDMLVFPALLVPRLVGEGGVRNKQGTRTSRELVRKDPLVEAQRPEPLCSG